MTELNVQKRENFLDELKKMEDRVMRRAYDIFRGNGFEFGRDLENWLAAERELVWKPAIELKEKDHHFEVTVAVAGMDPKDLKVDVTADDLLVRGEMKSEKMDDKGTVHTSEFGAGSLFRAIRFPKKVDVNKVTAEVKNGLLTVTAAIAEEAKARKVEIRAA
ncbi:MAG TPA: Hsp20/alpha crystallin family protein [Terriglobia bacterium]|nr:Hsp20/alpha crystallin family protein [Terriglobia bacterium]